MLRVTCQDMRQIRLDMLTQWLRLYNRLAPSMQIQTLSVQSYQTQMSLHLCQDVSTLADYRLAQMHQRMLALFAQTHYPVHRLSQKSAVICTACNRLPLV